MFNLRSITRAALMAASLCASGLATAAPVVYHSLTDEADVVPGSDTWRYDLRIEGSASAFESVSLLFTPSRFADLVSSGGGADLSLLDVQPDTGLPVDGMVTATLLADLTAPLTFSVVFSWLGQGAPGALPYEYLDANFSQVATGNTRVAGGTTVPEPSMLATLLLMAGAAMHWRRRAAGHA
ncbi:PEP-CTERM sorting domain-containing protein [Aquabacterium sp. OR-4]|uniref:PEP-CTERM sorting domain-containing protein n=1 Tax=Aquabacterium sp. OR-4 TaxID=2978127 RepID=UPI0021B38AB9|nr:PEP-CTERM sorting domain-containing protein [Aquabacterium sp. OR-4]MDT7837877.1 hypothetical protein [Aquabacterium sp. OR-4]